MKRILITGSLILIAVLATPQFFTWNITASLPQGLYIRIFPAVIKQGQCVRFKLEESYNYPWHKNKYLLKEVAAVAGDYVSITANGYYVNNRYLGSILQTDKAGNPLPHFRFEGTLPAGQLFVVGYGKSFDSRYFGAVAAAKVHVFKKLF